MEILGSQVSRAPILCYALLHCNRENKKFDSVWCGKIIFARAVRIVILEGQPPA
jgi:hypothetical protein